MVPKLADLAILGVAMHASAGGRWSSCAGGMGCQEIRNLLGCAHRGDVAVDGAAAHPGGHPVQRGCRILVHRVVILPICAAQQGPGVRMRRRQACSKQHASLCSALQHEGRT